MATLTLTIGPLTSSRTVTNERAQAVLSAAFDLRHPEGGDYTNQQKLDWIVQQLIPQLLTQLSRQHHERTAVDVAMREFDENGAKFD